MANQVWSWDITKLKGPVKWTYFYLYVIIDIFSRYVVGWMVAHREQDVLAKRLIEETCAKQSIDPGQLTIHADRGSSMKSKVVAHLLGEKIFNNLCLSQRCHCDTLSILTARFKQKNGDRLTVLLIS